MDSDTANAIGRAADSNEGVGSLHTLDQAGSDPHTRLDLFFESFHRGISDAPFMYDTDIAHASVTMHLIAPTPEIAVDGLTDGQAATVGLGRTVVGATRPTATFTVRNTGSAQLDLVPISLPPGFLHTEGLNRVTSALGPSMI